MKIGLYADPHVSQSSGILVGKIGNNEFSGRLDNLIKCFDWMRGFFNDQGCKKVICLGDMTDKPVLTAEEISAMSRFVGCSNDIMIVGNHCRSNKDGSINTLKSTFNAVYSEPAVIDCDGCKVLLLPYNSTPSDLSEIGHVDVILSHNDIKGYDFGGHISKSGYDLHDIVSNCKLFINGHLHNGGWLVNGKVINLGQLSGMNFSSCGGQWEPSVGILDTETLELTIYENPVAYRFKKLEFNSVSKLKSYLDNLPTKVLKYRLTDQLILDSEEYTDSMCEYILQVKVPAKISASARKLLDQSNKVVASRVLVTQDRSKASKSTKVELSSKSTMSNVYSKLREFVNTQSSKFDAKIMSEVINSLESQEGAD